MKHRKRGGVILKRRKNIVVFLVILYWIYDILLLVIGLIFNQTKNIITAEKTRAFKYNTEYYTVHFLAFRNANRDF